MNELLDHYRKPLDEYVSDFAAEQQRSVAAIGGTNHGIHVQRLGDLNFPDHQQVPHSVYFYYVRVDSDGRLHVTHHFYPGGDPNEPGNPPNPADWPSIPRDEEGLKALLRDLALDARPTGAGNYPVIGQAFRDIVWRRKSYIAIFVDELNWKLHKLAATEDPAVVFITELKNGKQGLENHTFFDAMDLDIEMPINGSADTDKRSAVVFINHMKADEAGNDLEAGPGQFFQFKMFFDVEFSIGGKAITVIFDPGGTNIGPPPPPP